MPRNLATSISEYCAEWFATQTGDIQLLLPNSVPVTNKHTLWDHLTLFRTSNLGLVVYEQRLIRRPKQTRNNEPALRCLKPNAGRFALFDVTSIQRKYHDHTRQIAMQVAGIKSFITTLNIICTSFQIDYLYLHKLETALCNFSDKRAQEIIKHISETGIILLDEPEISRTSRGKIINYSFTDVETAEGIVFEPQLLYNPLFRLEL